MRVVGTGRDCRASVRRCPATLLVLAFLAASLCVPCLAATDTNRAQRLRIYPLLATTSRLPKAVVQPEECRLKPIPAPTQPGGDPGLRIALSPSAAASDVVAELALRGDGVAWQYAALLDGASSTALAVRLKPLPDMPDVLPELALLADLSLIHI